ncbi:MAG: glycosyltransferase family 2 protein [Chloroflexi bacterium]|nr:glycosyltransferase family 2 protein [Chloroflexota bacterium]
MNKTLTAAIITRDEAGQIAECLESAQWADELLVVDAFSSDSTVAICRRHTDRVYQRQFVSFPAQRNIALSLARSDWVLFLDADERVPSSLAEEIKATLSDSASETTVGYWIPRRNLILGRWIRYGGWSPDHQLRLLRRGSAQYDDTRLVHEVVLLNGEAGYLTEAIIHYNYRTFWELWQKQARYALLEAEGLAHQGVKPRRRSLLGQPLREFHRRYWQLQGWRDGGHGLLLACAMAWYAGLVQWRLRQTIQRQETPPMLSQTERR